MMVRRKARVEMKQLTGVDVGFLLMESPNTYGYVNGLSIYQRPSPEFDHSQRSANDSRSWSDIWSR